jgi:hypothetical protein
MNKTIAAGFIASMLLISACEIMPRNTLKDCQVQCKNSKKSKACYDFCDCIHKYGNSLDSCLNAYDMAPEDSTGTP